MAVSKEKKQEYIDSIYAERFFVIGNCIAISYYKKAYGQAKQFCRTCHTPYISPFVTYTKKTYNSTRSILHTCFLFSELFS